MGRGQTEIPPKVLTKIVAAATQSIAGVVAIDKFAGRSYPSFDISTDSEGKTCDVEAHIAVAWPAPAARVAAAVRAAIIEWVPRFTGVEVSRANVIVGGVVRDERVNAKQVAASAAVGPQPRPIQVVASAAYAPEVHSQRPSVPVVTTPELEERGFAPVVERTAPEVSVERHPVVADFPIEVTSERPDIPVERNAVTAFWDVDIAPTRPHVPVQRREVRPFIEVDFNPLGAPIPIERSKPRPFVPVERAKPRPFIPVTRAKPRPFVPVERAKLRPFVPVERAKPRPFVPVERAKPRPFVPVERAKPRPFVPVTRVRPRPFVPVGVKNQRQLTPIQRTAPRPGPVTRTRLRPFIDPQPTGIGPQRSVRVQPTVARSTSRALTSGTATRKANATTPRKGVNHG